MAGSCEYGWLNAQRADGRRARDTMMMIPMTCPINPRDLPYCHKQDAFSDCTTSNQQAYEFFQFTKTHISNVVFSLAATLFNSAFFNLSQHRLTKKYSERRT